MNPRYLLIIFLVCLPVRAFAQASDDLWITVLRATNYPAIAKASLMPGCKAENPLSYTAPYRRLCPKLNAIPNSVIETAALPFYKTHLTEDLARQAISFWISPEGKALNGRLIKEIETGINNQLSADDRKLLDSRNKTTYGLALNKLGSDGQLSRAVIQAMLAYEP